MFVFWVISSTLPSSTLPVVPSFTQWLIICVQRVEEILGFQYYSGEVVMICSTLCPSKQKWVGSSLSHCSYTFCGFSLTPWINDWRTCCIIDWLITNRLVVFVWRQVFHDIAYKAKDRQDLLAGIEEFLDEVIVLPPGEWDPDIRIEPPKSLPSSDKRSALIHTI